MIANVYMVSFGVVKDVLKLDYNNVAQLFKCAKTTLNE